MLKYFILVIAASFLYSCKDQYTICDLPKNVNLRGVFYTKSGNNFIETKVASLSINLLDSAAFIYKDRKNVSTFIFELQPFMADSDFARYVIKIDNVSQPDTVTIHYTSATVNLTKECGSIIAHTLSQVSTTHNTLDSVKIIVPKIDNNLNVNLKLFF